MGTPYETIYDAFLSKVLEDEWAPNFFTEEEIKADINQIMEAALPWIKFPRVSFDRDESGFTNELPNELIQLIANYMKFEWVQRCILTWENIKPLYEERDFSQANLLDSLNDTAEQTRKEAKRLEDVYYRSRNGKSFDYTLLAGEH